MPARPSAEGCGPVGRGPELASPSRAAGVLTPAEVRAEDLADVADTLRRVAASGPLLHGQHRSSGRARLAPRPCPLHRPGALAGLVERVRIRLGVEDVRVTASALVQGHAARLWSLSLGALVRDRRLPDLNSDVVLWRDQDGRVRLHLKRAAGWASERLEDVLAGTVIAGHLAPMITAAHRLGPLSDRLLCGNAASALLGATRALDGAPTGPARLVANRLLTQGPLRNTVEEYPGGGHRRCSCCLFYRVTGGGLCGDCAPTRSPTTRTGPGA